MLTFSPDGSRLGSVDDDVIRLVDVETGKPVRAVKIPGIDDIFDWKLVSNDSGLALSTTDRGSVAAFGRPPGQSGGSAAVPTEKARTPAGSRRRFEAVASTPRAWPSQDFHRDTAHAATTRWLATTTQAKIR